jgi:hypothetical protein
MDEYCRQMKTMADTLRTLGAPITNECLVLNLLRGLSPRFDRVTPILTRMKPFPTFAETKNDLLLEELRLVTATAAPATALYNASRAPPLPPGGSSSPHFGPPPPGALRQPTGSGGGSRSWSRPWSQEWTRWPTGRPRPFTGWLPVAILLQPVDWHHPDVARAVRRHLGPSPRHPQQVFFVAPPPAVPSAPSQPQQGLLPLPGPLAPHVWGPWTNGWDTQSLANSFSTMTLAPPTSVSDWVADSGASYHTTPDAGILSSTSPPPTPPFRPPSWLETALPFPSPPSVTRSFPVLSVYPTFLLLPTLFKIFFPSVSLLLTTLVP